MLKEIVKATVIAAAPIIAVHATLMAIGYIAERAEMKRLTRDAEHYANCPKNKI